MKTWWKFFAALGGGFALVLAVHAAAFYLCLGVPTESSRWCFELYSQKSRAAASIPSPKLLLVGGSATLFGLSAAEIEKQTGARTINLGTHAALRSEYLLGQAQRIAKPGDTVLLCLEYELYTYGTLAQTPPDEVLADYLLARDPDYFSRLSLLEKWNLFMATPEKRLERGVKDYFRAEPPHDDGGIYNSKYLDALGDQTHHPQASRPPGADEVIQRQKDSVLIDGLPERPYGFSIIASFCAWARANHIRVLATFPNLCRRPEYDSPAARAAVSKIERFFASQGVPVLGTSEEAILPPEDFYDTLYHLTDEAAITRTDRLLKHLAPVLDSESRLR